MKLKRSSLSSILRNLNIIDLPSKSPVVRVQVRRDHTVALSQRLVKLGRCGGHDDLRVVVVLFQITTKEDKTISECERGVTVGGDWVTYLGGARACAGALAFGARSPATFDKRAIGYIEISKPDGLTGDKMTRTVLSDVQLVKVEMTSPPTVTV